MFGWAAMIVFLLFGVIGAGSMHSWFGIVVFGALLFFWLRMGWRGARSARERAGAVIAVVLLLLAVVGLTILVALWLD